ncbi:cysteine-rich receptor-like protein kinase 25 isoform X1 [Pistacia vera]|uniref:cysteine-rich receptor-like protein kinase 25 isoform X1 n=1 Tax=Pistacia vera TaxID=55513 RepID=UPI001263E4B7|nr:cysteine-rich receptor-like protein kinase 25 isoform X1 [Pistacia vera]
MASSRLRFFLSLYFIYYFDLTVADELQSLYHDCYVNNGNYTTNSTYKANLNHLLNSLTNTTPIYNGFYHSSYGKNPDKVYGSAICRPDMDPDTCRDSVTVATRNLAYLCPNFRMAIGGYDDYNYTNCMLRYAYYDMIGVMENAPYFFVYSLCNITENVEEFNQTRQSLLQRLISQATAGGSNKYAAGEEAVSTIVTLYGLVQCTPDLTESKCNECLIDANKLLPNCCDTRQGGRVITPSCSFRYETNEFYKSSIAGPPVSPPTPSTNTTTQKGKNNYIIIIIVVVSVVTSVILIIGIIILLRWRKRKEKNENVEEIKDTESLQFDFGTIQIATDNFSDDNKLGQGGFGVVYKGMLSNGQQVAVKRLSKNSKQGEVEFKNEVLLVAKLQHRNLVRLLGFCLEGKERILVYEFVPNSSLDQFIFDPIKREYMEWERRYKIIGGISRGLLYVHEDSRLRIIHRDLKASNILLDSDMNPKISDFGMTKLFEVDESQSDTNQVVGTFGYMASEYVKYGRFSVKSDIYSFGVLFLEIVSGQKRSGFGSKDESDDLLTYVSVK